MTKHLVPKNLASRLQTPTLIGCIFLKTTAKFRISSSFLLTSLRSAKPQIVAQFFSCWQNFFQPRQPQPQSASSFSQSPPTQQSLRLYTAFRSTVKKFRKSQTSQPTQDPRTSLSANPLNTTPTHPAMHFRAVEPASIHRFSGLWPFMTSS